MLTFVDLFCGGGFGARGAVSAEATPLLAVDAWDLATETYQHNFPEAEVLTERIENVVPRKYAKKYQPDVLLTSPECTSHSIARGARPGCEQSKETALGIIPWMRALKPRWVIVENVPQMKKWDGLENLIRDIRGQKYEVSPLELNAADFGAPQARKRMFLVCDRMGTRITEEDLFKLHRRRRKTAASIIDRSGQYKSKPLYSPNRAKATIERAERAIAELGRNKDFLIVYYGSDYAGGWQRLEDPLRTVTTLDRFGLVTWEKGEPQLRMLQPPELLKAMCGNSKHKLPVGNRRDKVKLCGNGVCSPVTEIIFKKLNELALLELNVA
ncbi:DNA cytosine methyltransferase [Microbulbifer sp. JTAC008]|uniref:DNA cytosine methyltransferase n=1 Tax=Microbulbifer sp. JTAC008 TaxID=3243374 RepID=UPI0040397068